MDRIPFIYLLTYFFLEKRKENKLKKQFCNFFEVSYLFVYFNLLNPSPTYIHLHFVSSQLCMYLSSGIPHLYFSRNQISFPITPTTPINQLLPTTSHPPTHHHQSISFLDVVSPLHDAIVSTLAQTTSCHLSPCTGPNPDTRVRTRTRSQLRKRKEKEKAKNRTGRRSKGKERTEKVT